MVHEFYAVTLSSVYRVFDKDENGLYPAAEKIALRGKSRLPVGHRLEGGTMIAICNRLVPYFPEGSGWLSPTTSFERKIEMVSTAHWGQSSAPIVALFLTKEEAMYCSRQSDLRACDPRWLKRTKTVLDGIGENHPAFEVCHYEGLSLLSIAKSKTPA